jgi:hypothetical protein
MASCCGLIPNSEEVIHPTSWGRFEKDAQCFFLKNSPANLLRLLLYLCVCAVSVGSVAAETVLIA